MHLEELLTQLNANLARNNELLELALAGKAAPAAAPVLIPAEKETPAPAKTKAPKSAAKEAPAPVEEKTEAPEETTPEIAHEVAPEPAEVKTPVAEKTEAPAPDEKISEAQQVAIRAIVREHQQKVGPAAFNAGFQSLLKEHDIQKIAQLNVGEHDAFVAKLLAIA